MSGATATLEASGVGVLAGLFDEPEPTEAKPAPATTAKPTTTPATKTTRHEWSSRFCYFDVETIPDDSRVHLFDLEPLPEQPTRLPLAECGPVEDVRGHDIPGVKAWIAHNNPCGEFLDAIRAAEQADKKPRKGVLDAIDSYVESLAKIDGAAADRRKLLSLTPEYCSVCAIGFGGDNTAPIESYVVGIDGTTEASLLQRFWEIAGSHDVRHLVGFNVMGFDLPVILTRSLLLGVEPTKQLDLSPYRDHVVDLMARRWPKGGAKPLKTWAKLLGVSVPEEGVDGSQVAELFATDPAALRRYVASDIAVTQTIHERFAGLFWPR